jgi:hypothetical protein
MQAITVINYDGDSIAIFDANSLYLVFEIVPPQACSAIISQVSNNLGKIITNDREFLKILGKVFGLKGERKIEYLEALGDHLPNIVTKGDTLTNSLSLIHDPDDQLYLLHSIGRNGLRNCIKSLDHLVGCLEWLYGKMDTNFCELIGWDYVIRFVRNGEALGLVLKYLNETEEKIFLEMLGWNRVFDCVQTTSDLYYVLNGLDAGNEMRFIELISNEKLLAIIPFEDSLEKICKRYLSEEDSILLKKKYKEALAQVRSENEKDNFSNK